MRNRKFISLLLGCAMCSCVTTGMVLSASADEGATQHTITINLGDGFMWDSESGKAKEDTTVTYTTSAETITFTHDFVQTEIFDYPVFGKIVTETNAGGTYDPHSSDYKNKLSSILFGLTDESGNVYQSGDTYTVTRDATLTCYYNTGLRYTSLEQSSMSDSDRIVTNHDTMLELHRPYPQNKDPKAEYTARELQPFYHKLTVLGSSCFNNNTVERVELPDTVITLGNSSLKSTNLVSVTGLQNVETIRQDAFTGWGTANAENRIVFNSLRLNKLSGTNALASTFLGATDTRTYRYIFDGHYQDSKIEGANVFGSTIHGADNLEADYTEMDVIAYVPYGQTKNYFPGNSAYNNNNAFKSTSTRANVPMREMHKITFDLDGGTVNGATMLGATYMDARAVSVTRNDAEVNMFNDAVINEEGDTITGGYSKNPAAQTLSLLKAQKPANPIKAGYTFVGWEDENGVLWTDDDWANGGKSGYTKGNVVLKAKFAETPKVSVTYVKNNGENNEVVGGNVVSETVTRPTDPAKQYYTFAGWYTDEACTQAFDFATELCPSADFSLYAKWTAVQMSTKLVVNGGSLITTSIITKDGDDYNISYAYDLGVATLPVPVKDNYTFDGWYFDANFETKCEAIAANTANLTTLYAKFSATMRKVTYVLDGGVLDGEKTFDEYQQGTAFTLPTPTKTGYTFEGWYYNLNFEESKATSVSETNDVTVYAKWSEVVTPPSNETPDSSGTPDSSETPDNSETPDYSGNSDNNTSTDDTQSSGCFGSIGSLGVVGLVGLLSVAGVALKSKKDEE